MNGIAKCEQKSSMFAATLATFGAGKAKASRQTHCWLA
ncbi:hypothetical protein JCM19237_2699 [Photobacterium aphoticum]|uniref:Uncharacterized protein n=1 Tax=Photobacterium aphoticum TaxID=754436 RepID=A0A090RGC3_9GAMM|nr:hypothetical protein JCM19237_2699 [Photobacterium aphoticum]